MADWHHRDGAAQINYHPGVIIPPALPVSVIPVSMWPETGEIYYKAIGGIAHAGSVVSDALRWDILDVT